MYETMILAIVSEVWFEHQRKNRNISFESVEKVLLEKLKYANKHGIPFIEFGTRRRFSRVLHELVVAVCVEKGRTFKGASNLDMARTHEILAMGTMAHEWICAWQTKFNFLPAIVNSDWSALHHWLEHHKGRLAIALTDTLTTKHFFKVFDEHMANAYQGVRQDSGDPFKWGRDMILHYERLGIDPRIKTLVFSDGLDFRKARKINDMFKRKADVVFGIGTNLTNDVPGHKPLNMVVKLVECGGRPVIKISDSPGKVLCEDLDYGKRMIAAVRG